VAPQAKRLAGRPPRRLAARTLARPHGLDRRQLPQPPLDVERRVHERRRVPGPIHAAVPEPDAGSVAALPVSLSRGRYDRAATPPRPFWPRALPSRPCTARAQLGDGQHGQHHHGAGARTGPLPSSSVRGNTEEAAHRSVTGRIRPPRANRVNLAWPRAPAPRRPSGPRPPMAPRSSAPARARPRSAASARSCRSALRCVREQRRNQQRDQCRHEQDAARFILAPGQRPSRHGTVRAGGRSSRASSRFVSNSSPRTSPWRARAPSGPRRRSRPGPGP
jgi:hypothetical protein